MHTTTAIQNTTNMRSFLSSRTKEDPSGIWMVKEGTPYMHGRKASSLCSRFETWLVSAVALFNEGSSSSISTCIEGEIFELLHSSVYNDMARVKRVVV